MKSWIMSKILTFDSDFVFASSRMSEQINLDTGFADASFFDAREFCHHAKKKSQNVLVEFDTFRENSKRGDGLIDRYKERERGKKYKRKRNIQTHT